MEDSLSDFKTIHIGKYIERRVVEMEIEQERICRYFQCNFTDLAAMYEKSSMDTEVLLRWSKLLEYNFFRIYIQHLILFSPFKSVIPKVKTPSSLPQFKKNIYTREIIDFIIELITSGEKTKSQIIDEYNIPKTTLYKWLAKYK